MSNLNACAATSWFNGMDANGNRHVSLEEWGDGEWNQDTMRAEFIGTGENGDWLMIADTDRNVYVREPIHNMRTSPIVALLPDEERLKLKKCVHQKETERMHEILQLVGATILFLTFLGVSSSLN